MESGKVGNRFQVEHGPEIGVVNKLFGDAAVVRLEQGFQNETGEQLRLGKLLGTEAVRVEPQPLGTDCQSLTCDAHWRLAECAHRGLDARSCQEILRFSGFLQSTPDPFFGLQTLAAMSRVEPFDMTDEERAAADAWEKKVNDYTVANLNKGIEDVFR